jgi:hypothetical protein
MTFNFVKKAYRETLGKADWQNQQFSSKAVFPLAVTHLAP